MALIVLMWSFGIAVAPWIITYPPVSYQGLGLVASVGWGVMVGAGSVFMLIGHLLRSHQWEIPGVILCATGFFVYALVSWQQVFEGSVGSGSRALLMCMFFCWVLLRGDVLIGYHRTLKRVDKIGRG